MREAERLRAVDEVCRLEGEADNLRERVAAAYAKLGAEVSALRSTSHQIHHARGRMSNAPSPYRDDTTPLAIMLSVQHSIIPSVEFHANLGTLRRAYDPSQRERIERERIALDRSTGAAMAEVNQRLAKEEEAKRIAKLKKSGAPVTSFLVNGTPLEPFTVDGEPEGAEA